MFNAVNILEALKNYIHARGGASNAYNIAEAVNDLNSIPQGSGGDIPPEVSNAVETHGMGWTSEEEVSGFDITWDGNTEGLESLGGQFFKISDKVYTEDELVGANGEFIMDDIVYKGIVSLFVPERESADMDFFRYYSINCDVPERFDADQSIIVILEDAEIEDEGEVISFHKGTYFYEIADIGYTSHVYREASTKEVVHQIDQKYIPQGQAGGGMVVKVTADPATFALSADKTFAEIQEAFHAGVNIVANLYVGEDFANASLSCISCDAIRAWFGTVSIDKETLNVRYELQCVSEDGVDEWSSRDL